MAELSQGREPATTERGDVGQQAAYQLLAAFLIAALFQQRVAEPLFKAVASRAGRSLSMQTSSTRCLPSSRAR